MYPYGFVVQGHIYTFWYQVPNYNDSNIATVYIYYNNTIYFLCIKPYNLSDKYYSWYYKCKMFA